MKWACFWIKHCLKQNWAISDYHTQKMPWHSIEGVAIYTPLSIIISTNTLEIILYFFCEQ